MKPEIPVFAQDLVIAKDTVAVGPDKGKLIVGILYEFGFLALLAFIFIHREDWFGLNSAMLEEWLLVFLILTIFAILVPVILNQFWELVHPSRPIFVFSPTGLQLRAVLSKREIPWSIVRDVQEHKIRMGRSATDCVVLHMDVEDHAELETAFLDRELFLAESKMLGFPGITISAVGTVLNQVQLCLLAQCYGINFGSVMDSRRNFHNN